MLSAGNYNAWLFSLVQPHLGERVFEVGCGIGSMTERILASGRHVFGIEPNRSCAVELETRLGCHPGFEHRPWRIEDCDRDLLGGLSFDTVLCVNVLEHVEDDRGALRLLTSLLDPAGRVVLLLPAVPGAFGPIDASVGHFRRYSKAMVRDAFREVALAIDRLRYSNLLGLLGWLYNARIRRITKQSDRQIALFDSIVPWYSWLERVVPPPIGMTLLAVGRRTA